MANKVTGIRVREVASGTEVQGIARSDRGSKYIAGSIVVLHLPGMRKQVKKEIAAAVEMLINGGN